METTYRQFFFNLRGKLLTGQVTYDQAIELAQPVLDEMNKKGETIAKKYGRKYRKISYVSVLRGN
jgi:hypothetical protein